MLLFKKQAGTEKLFLEFSKSSSTFYFWVLFFAFLILHGLIAFQISFQFPFPLPNTSLITPLVIAIKKDSFQNVPPIPSYPFSEEISPVFEQFEMEELAPWSPFPSTSLMTLLALDPFPPKMMPEEILQSEMKAFGINLLENPTLSFSLKNHIISYRVLTDGKNKLLWWSPLSKIPKGYSLEFDKFLRQLKVAPHGSWPIEGEILLKLK